MKAKQGFTLVEVLIATAIMVGVLGSLLLALSKSQAVTETARNRDIALNAAQEKLEEIINAGFDGAPGEAGDFDILDGGNPPAPLPNFNGLAAVAPVPEAEDDLLNVTVTVNWDQRGGRQLSRQLTTVIVNKD